MGSGNRSRFNRLAVLVETTEQLVDDPVRGGLAIAPLGDILEIGGVVALGDEHARVIWREAILADEARLLLVRQFRQADLHLLDEAFRQDQWQEVRIGEVAVVVRLFLRAHGAGLALAGIVEPGLLIDLAAVFENADLPAGLDLDRLTDEADRVDVLDLAARAEGCAWLTHGDVDVRAQVALLHVAVAGAEITQDGTQLGHVGLRFLRRAKVRLRNDFHQRNAGAVEIDEGVQRVLIVDRLAGVLLEMQALDAHVDRLRLAGHIDDHLALTDDGFGELADLVALRQIGVEVVLAVEARAVVDLRLEAQPCAHGLRHTFLVDDRQHARHRGIDEAHMRVRLAAEFGRGAGEQLRAGVHLRVDLHADDDFPIGLGTLDPVFGRGGADIEGHARALFCNKGIPRLFARCGPSVKL